jgi:hypothetical protein
MTGYFKDPHLDRRFSREGYVVVKLLGSNEVTSLSAEARQLLPADRPLNDPQGAAYASYFDLEHRAAASALIRSFVEPALGRLLTGFRPLFSTFFWKPAHGTETPIHQHSPYVSDLRGPTIDCWCPLVDCSRDAGALMIVPRSQRLTKHIQVPSRPAYWQAFAPMLTTDYMEAIEVPAGHAVLFDDTMPHGAAANDRPHDRLATLTTLVPEHAAASYVLGDEGDAVAVAYAAHDEYAYSDMFHDRLPPRGYWRTLSRVDDGCEWIDADECRRRLGARGVFPRGSWQRRLSTAGGKLMGADRW